MHRIAIVLAVFVVLPAISEAATDPMRSAPMELAQRPLVSGERVQVQRLARDLESAMQTLDQGGVAPFQDLEHGRRWQSRVEQYRANLARYPQVDDPGDEDRRLVCLVDHREEVLVRMGGHTHRTVGFRSSHQG